MSEASDPRSKLDVIYRDVMGEVGTLVEALGQVSQTVNSCIVEAKKLPMDVRQVVGETNRRLNDEAMQEMARVCQRLEALMQLTEQHRRSVMYTHKRLVALTAILGGTAGVLGGLLAAALWLSLS
ncbi:hypothetical protein [Castellaniella sp.]|uniref:hypothetical protein n=1 Tax=Castellaniella sp. TaxID=1955812 RepID=UPI002AFDFEC3|nr:hypothetical protein [Castellaniella sp.]